jgi:hypothetical protein
MSRATPPPFLPVSGSQPTPVTFQQLGLDEGSSFVLSAEEAAELERREAEALAERLTALHVMLDSATGCRACGAGNGLGDPLGLCPACRPIVDQLRSEAARAEVVDGHRREEWCRAYIARTDAQRRTA